MRATLYSSLLSLHSLSSILSCLVTFHGAFSHILLSLKTMLFTFLVQELWQQSSLELCSWLSSTQRPLLKYRSSQFKPFVCWSFCHFILWQTQTWLYWYQFVLQVCFDSKLELMHISCPVASGRLCYIALLCAAIRVVMDEVCQFSPGFCAFTVLLQETYLLAQ